MKGANKREQLFRILPDRCTFKSSIINGKKREICMICSRSLGCPSIVTRNNKLIIDEMTCVGCGVCAQICPSNAIAGTES